MHAIQGCIKLIKVAEKTFIKIVIF